jgi:hypothetical protein
MSVVDAVFYTWWGAWSVFILLAVARSWVELRRIREGLSSPEAAPLRGNGKGIASRGTTRH